MKIFVLLPRIPFPLEKGDKLRAFNQIKQLAKHNEIVLCALNDNAKVNEQDAFRALQPYCQSINFIKITKPQILLGLVRAFFKGLLLWLTAALPADTFALRCLWYVLGILLGAASIAFFFKTYIAPEVYELLVKEIAQKLQRPTHRVKTVYDCVSCAVAVLMSFAFFGLGRFEGVKLGTVICALVNGYLIGRCTAFYERVFEFRDALPWRKYFT